MAKQEKVYWPSSEETNIKPVEIVDEVKASMLQYGMSVLVGRALPDVRDGLKPVHRRILYTMYDLGLTPEKPYKKCATTVGAVLGSYHPHGDASVYDAMVRMAQDFSLRYPLVDGHGNFGNIDGYPPAAYRYTEAKMNKLSLQMLDDIEKDTVDFVPNFDDSKKEPSVLPVRFPQLLVNGSSGIAFGMATEIPPHNLGEVIDGMCCLIDNPDADLQEICQHIKGPDFPTGAIIMGRSGIRAAYATGKGKITVRGKTEIEELSNGKSRIVITEIPYKVRKEALVKKIYDLAAEKRIEGIDDVVDYSSKRDGGIRIVVDVKKDVNPQVVLNKIFAYTELQTTFGANLIAIVNGKPQVLTLKEMLQNNIDFQCEIVERKTRFDMKKAQERAHILEGLKTALDFIDEVINIIRKSADVNEAKANLCERFSFDDVQATAIVQMQLGKLANLEKQKILDELDEKLRFIKECQDILSSKARILDVVKTQSLNLRDRFSDDRRTQISDVAGEVDIEDLIPEEDSVVTLTHYGYIKRIPADVYRTQARSGRGVSGMKRREDDFVKEMFVSSSHDYVLFVTDRGKIYRLKCFEIPEGSRTSKGSNIINLLPIEQGEKIAAMIHLSDLEDEGKYLIMATEKGLVKRTALKEYKNIRKTGLIAVNLKEGDSLCAVRLTDGNDTLMLATKKGKAVRFEESAIRAVSRNASGVRGIRLREGDKVVAFTKVTEGETILTVTDKGFGKRCQIDQYRIQTRGGYGSTNYRVDDKRGDVCGVMSVNGDDDLMLISDNGVIIRIRIGDISISSRNTLGVRIMKLDDDSKVASFASVAHDDEAETNEVEKLSPEELLAQEKEAALEAEAEETEAETPEAIDDEQ
ncbi:MAG: DNA gyrase subunit A [Oscillospiraceae bacterium]|nr:DNA gyrase subunit A [Oscillospiraceae bacterium]